MRRASSGNQNMPSQRTFFECWTPETGLTFYGDTLDQVVEFLDKFAPAGRHRIRRVTTHGDREPHRFEAVPWGVARVDARGVTIRRPFAARARN